ncbi:MAG: AraC family transcriptional regulator [Sneathiella sp.]|nr:AraC family transcriptional regulator [Sneathiella sp.]
MNDFFKITSISELHRHLGYSKPEHPLISVLDLSKVENTDYLADKKIVTSYYSVYLKTGGSSIKYGRKHYDFEEGSVITMAPEQVFSFSSDEDLDNLSGWVLYFHPDLIRKYPLAKRIEQFGFFSYEINEALHLSDKERTTITSIFQKITEEYELNIDEFSHDVLVTNVELLLNYILRYYKRQFITRTTVNSDLLSDFEILIKEYFQSEQLEVNGLPKVSWFADKLNLSSSYLSDMLKKETGKNLQEQIHYYVIEKSKNILLNSTLTVSEISYQLGFEYPQYFSRLFKNKTGMSPNQYRILN